MRTRILLVFSLSPVLLAFLPITLAAGGLEGSTLRSAKSETQSCEGGLDQFLLPRDAERLRAEVAA